MSAFSVQRLRGRELGMSPRIGDGDALARSLYCNMKPVGSWDPFQLSGSPVYGGIFNLEFSPGGSLLVAACEKKSVLIFDPLTHERIHTVNDAHADCVNCVKFLDGRMFATCSDDTTIALWDVRNLKKKIRTLSGHSNWVKNIEYSVKDNLLVTSGLDGSIYTWDINSYTEWSLVYQRVFHASGLMRCRISPDASQMVMCTTGGLLVIIHDLNLSTLARDLQGFKPNLYRLMQMSQQLIPIAACYDRLFDSKRHENRVEFVTDFPEGNDAEVVSSLQIHPQGWSALSRNISHDDRSEWTCIHDIQPDPNSGDKSVLDRVLGGGGGEGGEDAQPPPALLPQRTLRCTLWRLNGPHAHRHDPARNARDQSGPSGGGAGRRGGGDAGPSGSGPSSSREPPPAPSGSGASAATSPPEPASRVNQSVGIQNDVWEASITIKQHRTLQEMARRGQVGRNFNMQRIMGINTGITPPAEPPRRRGRSRTAAAAAAAAASSAASSSTSSSSTTSSSASATPPASINDRIGVRPLGSSSTVRVRYLDPDPDEPEDPLPEHDPPVRTIRQNKKRLLYYTQETNEGKGFIKELCFSSDGRLVCSPFGYGIRLLALNDQCSELSHCVEEGARPRGLVELGQSAGQHPDLVVSSKFSPRHYLLVSGCLAGKVVWYQPVG